MQRTRPNFATLSIVALLGAFSAMHVNAAVPVADRGPDGREKPEQLRGGMPRGGGTDRYPRSVLLGKGIVVEWDGVKPAHGKQVNPPDPRLGGIADARARSEGCGRRIRDSYMASLVKARKRAA
jgi:hypothetical protein